MNVLTAWFLFLTVFVVCITVFFLVVYLKEYAREKRTFEEILKARDKQQAQLGTQPVYVMTAPAPKKKKSIIDTDLTAAKTNKKNVN